MSAQGHDACWDQFFLVFSALWPQTLALMSETLMSLLAAAGWDVGARPVPGSQGGVAAPRRETGG